MPSTREAFVLFILAVLPGALYTWAFEREVGKWGVGATDRVFRFIGASVLFQLLFAAGLGVAGADPNYQSLLFRTDTDPPLATELRNASGTWLLAVAAVYVIAPLAGGTAAAAVERRRGESNVWRWAARVLNGRNPAPRAWDFLFSPRPAAIVRGRLKKHRSWIGGLFGAESYAAGYPELQDIYLESAYRMTPEGEFERDEEGRPIPTGAGLLVRWDELDSLEVFRLERR